MYIFNMEAYPCHRLLVMPFAFKLTTRHVFQCRHQKLRRTAVASPFREAQITLNENNKAAAHGNDDAENGRSRRHEVAPDLHAGVALEQRMLFAFVESFLLRCGVVIDQRQRVRDGEEGDVAHSEPVIVVWQIRICVIELE